MAGNLFEFNFKKCFHLPYNNNSNNDFSCAIIHEDQAQWSDKTKGLTSCSSFMDMYNGFQPVL